MPHETLVTLKEYVEARLESIEKAAEVAYRAMEKRLEGMNEFRGQIKDQASTFITKVEFKAYLDKIDGDIRVLREFKSALEGKASQSSVNVALLLSGIGILIALAGLLIKISGN